MFLYILNKRICISGLSRMSLEIWSKPHDLWLFNFLIIFSISSKDKSLFIISLSPSHNVPSLLTDADGWTLFYFHSHPWIKGNIYFFYDEWMVTMVIGGYLRYVAVNFQWLHNEFGRVGYVNLMDDQENLIIVQGAWVRCQGAWGIYQGVWGRCQGALMRCQGGSRMIEGWPMVVP